MNNISVGSSVIRLAPVSDYCRDRRGIVLEIKEHRARVHWLLSANSNPLNIKTWVRLDYLKLGEPFFQFGK